MDAHSVVGKHKGRDGKVIRLKRRQIRDEGKIMWGHVEAT